MRRRSYHQYCALARALDVIGERWTLLLIRELLLGSKRYTDLLDGLPGIGTNLLAERLKTLEAANVVRRTVAGAYELTELGRDLESSVFELGRWGAHFLEPRRRTDAVDPGWFFVSIRATFRPDVAANVRETYEFRIDGETFHARVDLGRAETGRGHATDPDLVVTTDLDGFLALLSGRLSPTEAVAGGNVRLAGRQAALQRFVKMFAWPPHATVAA